MQRQICCKEVEDYLEYYENNKEEFNIERHLLIENIAKLIYFLMKKFIENV